MIIPALSLAEEDSQQGRLDESRAKLIYQHTRLFVSEWAERGQGPRHGKLSPAHRPASRVEAPVVLCIPARDEADQISAMILAQLLRDRGIQAMAPEGVKPSGELVEWVARARPKLVCVCAVPPLGYIHARYICRHLKNQVQDARLIGVILTEESVEELEQRQPPLEADLLSSSLKQAINHVVSIVGAPSTSGPQKSLSA